MVLSCTASLRAELLLCQSHYGRTAPLLSAYRLEARDRDQEQKPLCATSAAQLDLLRERNLQDAPGQRRGKCFHSFLIATGDCGNVSDAVRILRDTV